MTIGLSAVSRARTRKVVNSNHRIPELAMGESENPYAFVTLTEDTDAGGQSTLAEDADAAG